MIFEESAKNTKYIFWLYTCICFLSGIFQQCDMSVSTKSERTLKHC